MWRGISSAVIVVCCAPAGLVGFVLLAGVVGCQPAGPTWEIVAENRSSETCKISVELAGGSYTESSVKDLAPGTEHVLLSASAKVIVRVVRGVCMGETQELKRNIEVPAGKRFLIVVNENGLLNTSLAEK
jgi:hypothetical protein